MDKMWMKRSLKGFVCLSILVFGVCVRYLIATQMIQNDNGSWHQQDATFRGRKVNVISNELKKHKTFPDTFDTDNNRRYWTEFKEEYEDNNIAIRDKARDSDKRLHQAKSFIHESDREIPPKISPLLDNDLHTPQKVSKTGEQRPTTAPLLIYNRIPKAGSNTLRSVMHELNKQTGQYHYYSSTKLGFDIVSDHKEQASIVESLQHLRRLSTKPIIYDRHINFLNFTEFGHPTPLYMNLMRDPLDHVISLYYYKQSQRHDFECRDETLDNCIAKGLLSKLPMLMHRPLNYICGGDPICVTFTPESVAIAKKRVKKSFVLVGITEDMHNFTWALEKLLPQYFSGLHRLFSANGDARVNVTPGKHPITEWTKDTLLKKLTLQYDFYSFVKEYFYRMVNKIKEGKLNPGPQWAYKAHTNEKQWDEKRVKWRQYVGYQADESELGVWDQVTNI